MDGRWCTTGGRESFGPTIGGERFRIRFGASGRRYVFSRIDEAVGDGDLDGAVVVVSTRDRAGEPRALWIGTGEGLRGGVSVPEHEIHAHWLAETPADRARVIADLGGAAVATLAA